MYCFHPHELADHFNRHRGDFGVTTDKDYEQRADKFLSAPMHQDLLNASASVETRCDTRYSYPGVCSAVSYRHDPDVLQARTVFISAPRGDTSLSCASGEHRLLSWEVCKMNICPACGYLMRFPPQDFHICPSCGTEFDYDNVGRSFAELRQAWISSGASGGAHPLHLHIGIRRLNFPLIR